MPSGIIDDPRQNPKEQRYGICKSDLGIRYFYDKKGEGEDCDKWTKRFWTHGTPIEIVKVTDPGLFIAEIEKGWDKDEDFKKDHPVVAALNKEAENNLKESEKKPTWKDKSESKEEIGSSV